MMHKIATLLTLTLLLAGCGRSNLLTLPRGGRADGAGAHDGATPDLSPPPSDRGLGDQSLPRDQGAPDGWPPTGSWAVSSVGKSYCSVKGMAVDSRGSVYYTASFQGPLQFGSHTVGSGTTWSGAMVRLDPSGKALWAKEIKADAPGGVDIDAQDRPHLMGGFGDQVDLDKFYKAPGKNFYVARMSPQGAFTWVVTSQGGGYVTTSYSGWPAGDLSLNPRGDMLITGTFRQKLTLGATTLTALGMNNSEMFAARLSKGGVFQWAIKGGGDKSDQGVAVAADASGGGLVTGTFMEKATLGNHTLTAPVKSGNTQDSFLARVDAKGKVIWAQAIVGSNSAKVTGLDLDVTGEPMVTGTYYGMVSVGSFKAVGRGVEDGFLGRLYRTGGPQLLSGVGGYASEASGGVASDHHRGVWITGGFNLTGYFGSMSKTSLGSHDVYLARYNLFTHKWDRLHRAGGPQSDQGSQVAVDRAGNVYVAGSTGGNGKFGKATLTPGGYSGCFVWKVGKTEL